MRLTVVGCAGTFPGPTSACSAYLVEHDGYRVLLDMGNGAGGALQRYLDIAQLDAVLVTHLHADHCLDLVTFSYARRFHPAGPLPVLPVRAPAGARERICRSFDADPADGLADVYEFSELSGGETTLGPFAVSLARTAHPVECYAVRLEVAGRRLTYSADTAPWPGLAVLADSSDVFLCEATWDSASAHPPGVHLTAAQAGEAAARAGADHLVLTHRLPWDDDDRAREAAGRSFHGRMSFATPGLCLDVDQPAGL